MIFQALVYQKCQISFKKSLFLIKQGPFTQNFAKQPYIFFVPKVLRIMFYPLKHPSQAQKLKNELKDNFFRLV